MRSIQNVHGTAIESPVIVLPLTTRPGSPPGGPVSEGDFHLFAPATGQLYCPLWAVWGPGKWCCGGCGAGWLADRTHNRDPGSTGSTGFMDPDEDATEQGLNRVHGVS